MRINTSKIFFYLGVDLVLLLALKTDFKVTVLIGGVNGYFTMTKQQGIFIRSFAKNQVNQII